LRVASSAAGLTVCSALAALGGAVPGASAHLHADGTGDVAPGALSNACRGEAGDEKAAIVQANPANMDVDVNWSARTCTLKGFLLGSANSGKGLCQAAGPHPNEICTDDAFCGSSLNDACTGPLNDDGTNQCICRAATGPPTTPETVPRRPAACRSSASSSLPGQASGPGSAAHYRLATHLDAVRRNVVTGTSTRDSRTSCNRSSPCPALLRCCRIVSIRRRRMTAPFPAWQSTLRRSSTDRNSCR